MSIDRNGLDTQAVQAIRDRLKGPRPGPLLRAMLFDYGILIAVIAGMVMLAGSGWFWALLPLAWVVIAARQHALLVLMHEATHGLAHPNRFINDCWGEVLLAAPMLVSMRKYRNDHLAHHRHANTEADPDWVRKLGTPEEARHWQFPVSGNGFGFLARSWVRSIGYLLKSFTHLSSVKQADSGKSDTDETTRTISRLRLGLYLLTAVLLTLSSSWWAFFTLWLAPILLVLPIIMRLRSIAEHFALPYDSELTATRTIVCGPMERFLFGPHGINYHLEHHLLASISFSELPKLHAALMQQPAYATRAQVNQGYLIGPRSLRMDMVNPEMDAGPQLSMLSQRAGAT